MAKNLSTILEACNIKQKELWEVTGFFDVVIPYLLEIKIDPEKFLDLCCGNGLLGMYIATKTGKQVLATDTRKTTKYRRLEVAMGQAYDLITYSFRQADIQKESFDDDISENSALVSIHACGQLTDRLIELALQHQKPFAVMPCCHKNEDPYFTPKDMPRRDGSVALYHDRVRLQYLREQGFDAHCATIDKRITSCNRIIIGTPKESN